MNLQLALDRTAIGLSVLCAVHCFLFPVVLILLSTYLPLTLNDEAFHISLLLVTVPVSLLALGMGCRKHQGYRVYAFGVAGFALLGIAIVFGHDYLGEFAERALTVLGGGVLAIGHIVNHRLCRKQECECAATDDA